MKQFYLSFFFFFTVFALRPALVVAQCPVAATCTPGRASNPQATAFGMGIFRVQLGSIDTTTAGNTDGYQNYSCTQRTQLAPGLNYPIRITTNGNTDENVRVWLDYNNDGSFDPVSELLFSSNGARLHAGVTAVIPTTAVQGVHLRLRVAADAQTSPVPTPCSTPQYSQTEDYSVLLGLPTQPPVAAFSVDPAQACSGVFGFTDQSQRGPATWRWSFGDGTFSTLRNPTHTYSQAGAYAVKLRACNAYGCDSVTETTAVTWYPALAVPAQCVPATSSYCCGYGITRVSFGGLAQASADAAAGYEDFTCRRRFSGQQNQVLPLQITTGGTALYNARVYIDYNNDGTFDEATERVFDALSTSNPAGTVRLASGGVVNTPLRMRVTAAANGLPISSACASLVFGQAEDYSLVITPTACTVFASLGVVVGDFAVCPGGNARLGLSTTPAANVFLQWQSSPDSLAWTDVVGANADTLSLGPIAVPFYYRMRAACGATTRTTWARRVAPDPNLCYCSNLYRTGTCGQQVNRLVRVWIPQTTLDHGALPCGATPAAVHYHLPSYPTNQTAILQRGGTYQLNLTTTLPTGYGSGVGLWIDYDHNGQFEASEYTAVLPPSALFTVPATALVGPTGMRLRTYSLTLSAGDACSNLDYGEAYDYTITIAPSQCAAPLNRGAVLGVRTFCPGSLPPLSVLGQTIGTTLQWQTSPDSLTWTNRPGLQSRLLTGAALSDSTYVRVQSSCGTSVAYTAAVYVHPDPQLCFCRPPATTQCPMFNWLTGLRLGNTPLRTQGSPCSTGAAYGYYPPTASANTATLLRGIAYPFLTYDLGTPYSGPLTRLWLDYNHDGVFTDDEATMLRSYPRQGDSLATFVVPANAPLGTLRMRVVSHEAGDWFNSRTLCSTISTDTRDYLVNIAAPTPAPGTPVAGTITGPPSQCPGQRLRLTVAGSSFGATLRWEAQTGGSTAAWQPIAGATGTVLLTAPFTTATSYRVAAIANGLTTYSTPLAVSVGPCPCSQNLVTGNVCNAAIAGVTLIGPGGAYLAALNSRCSASQIPYGYANYGLQHDSLHTTVLRGNSYNLSIIYPSNTFGATPVGGAWLDYNRNGVFESSEYTGAFTTTSPGLGGGYSLNISASAPLGQVTMRLRTTNTSTIAFDGTKGCATLTSGETEDYVLTIADACSLPAPDILFNGTLASSVPVAGGSLVMRSLRALPAGTTVRWTGPNGFSSTLAQPTLTNLSSANTGYYYLTVTNGNCQLTAARYLNMGTPTAVATAQNGLMASLYPNPSPGRTTLRLEAVADPIVEVVVLNSTGQTVWQTTVPTTPVATEVPLDLTQHPRGLYIVLVKTVSGTLYRKWVVE